MDQTYLKIFILLFTIYMLFFILYYIIVSRPYLSLYKEGEIIENDLLNIAEDIDTITKSSKPLLDDANKAIRELSKFSDDLYPFYCRTLVVRGVDVSDIPQNCFKS